MTTGRNAVELLIAEDEKTSLEFAALLNDMNQERRTVDQQHVLEAFKMIESDPNLKSKKSTVLFNPDWHKGVIGIVASRLIEKYYKPTILFTGVEGKATGSARSVEGFDVHAAIEQCADLLEQFGGHKYAAGLTIKTENIKAFTERFEKIVASTIEPEMLVPTIHIDAELENFSVLESTASEPLPKFYRILKQMEPFGPQNQAPVFITKNLTVASEPRQLTGNHLKLLVCKKSNANLKFDAIGFGLGDFADPITKGALFEMAYTIEENEWNGKSTLQLVIKDIRLQ
jgi:single-stranded-DNA-specific exonuclease